MYQRQRKNAYNLRIGREDGFLADALWAFKSKKKWGLPRKNGQPIFCKVVFQYFIEAN